MLSERMEGDVSGTMGLRNGVTGLRLYPTCTTFFVTTPLPVRVTASNSGGGAETVLICDDSGLIGKLCVELMPDF